MYRPAHPFNLIIATVGVVAFIVIPLRGQLVTEVEVQAGPSIGKFDVLHKNYVPPPEVSPGWVFIFLPANMQPVQVSRNGTVLLADGDFFYRWQNGMIETLHAAHAAGSNWVNPMNDRSYGSAQSVAAMNAAGEIALNFRFNATWSVPGSRDDYYDSVHWLKKWTSGTSAPSEFNTPSYDFTSLPFNRAYVQYHTGNLASLKALDDTGTQWVQIGDRVVTLFDYWGILDQRLLSKVVRISSSGTITETPFKRAFESSSYQLNGVSASGVAIGWVRNAGITKYYVGDNEVNFQPSFINANGWLIGVPIGASAFVQEPNGTRSALPSDGYVNWIDDQNRLNGYYYPPEGGGQRKAVWIKREGAPLTYERKDYARLQPPPPWSTTHEVAPGSTSIQLGLMTRPTDAGAETRSFLAVPCSIAVDANRDGQIKLASEDASDVTSVDRPYRFWINDDDDALIDSSVNIPLFSYTEIEEDDEDVEESGAPDSQNEVIDGKRDLEDLARLRITIGALRSLVHIGEVQDGEIKLGLRWKIASDTPAEGRNPSIRLFISPDATGSNRYLFDEDMAAAQVWQQGVVNFAQAIGVVDADDSAAFVLPDRVFTYAAPDMQLLFEGVEGGRGELQLVILKRNQGDFEEIGQGLSVHLELKRVNELCHRWTCGDGDSTPPEELRFDLGFAHLPSSASSLPAEERDLVLYVHGYNMSEYLKRRWIETTYKRLWHLGYKGRVGGFTWPTAQWAIKFANSEMIAWQSGEKLCALLADLKNRGYRVHMLAHSLGNVVAAEALQLWRQDGHTDRLVDTYIASQAAIPAAVYNPFAETMPDVENVPYSGIPRTTLPPDVYARYWKEGDSPRFPETWTNSNPSYSGKAYIQSTAGRWANFYNRNDYALSGFWEIGNRLKPAKLANFATGQLFNQYEYTAVDGFTKEFGTWIPPHWVKLSFMPLKFPDDRYDIFSYAAPAWSLALGTIPTEGAFTSSTNLAGATYGYGNEHLWHSGQFRSYYAARWRYWNQLLIDAQLKTPD